MLPIKNILHPTDFSKHSANAFEVACALARDYGARLVVMHAAPPPVIFMGEGIVPPEPNDRPQLLKQLQQVRPQDSKIQVNHLLVDGDAAAEIVRAAKESHADVIVMGTHGRTGIGRLVLGSVAEQVMRRAVCPVVTVKTPLVVAESETLGEEILVGANG